MVHLLLRDCFIISSPTTQIIQVLYRAQCAPCIIEVKEK